MSNPILDADYAAIEARIVCWLCDEQAALDEYRQGVDRYVRMASVIFQVPENEVNKHPQRFIGKQAILLSGFQGGPAKFRQTCEKFGYKTMPVGLENTAVEAYRAKHPKIKADWTNIDKCAKRAIINKGEQVQWKKCVFLHRDVEGMPFLFLKLPSGRKLAYPRPRVVPSKKFEGATCVEYFANIKGKTWGHVDTFGGKWLENITQAVAADIMCNGAHKAEENDFPIMTLIHDQALGYHAPGRTPERFVKLLTDLPAWAEGLPVEAEGALVPFYKKG